MAKKNAKRTTPAAHQNRYKALAAARAIRLAARGIHNGKLIEIPPQMADHEGRKLSVREMINAHLFPAPGLGCHSELSLDCLVAWPIAGQFYQVEQVLRRWAGMAGANQSHASRAVTARPLRPTSAMEGCPTSLRGRAGRND
jgi:hypothetical protein